MAGMWGITVGSSRALRHAQRDLPQLDEKLYLEVFNPPAKPAPRRAPAR